MARELWRDVQRIESSNRLLRKSGRNVLAAYQRFLDTDDLEQIRDALTSLEELLDTEDAMHGRVA